MMLRLPAVSGACRVMKSLSAQQLVLRRHADADGLRRAPVPMERLERDDAHLEAAGAAGDLGADAAEADDAQRLAAQLDAHELRALPACRRCSDACASGMWRAQGQHQADGVLRGGDRVALRRVDDDDAAPGRRVDVDVVDAGAGAADDLQLAAGVEDVGGHLGLAADDRGPRSRAMILDELFGLQASRTSTSTSGSWRSTARPSSASVR